MVYSEEHERLLGLLDRATSQMGVALGEAKQANDELTTLLAVVQQRRLSRSERLRYRRVERAEKNAVKHYLAARHWHESVAARLRDLRFRDDEVAGPAA